MVLFSLFVFLTVFRKKFPVQTFVTKHTPGSHNCITFKLVYSSAGTCNTRNHATHVIIQKADDFGSGLFAKAVFKTVGNCSKTSDIAEENCDVFKMRLKVNFLFDDSLSYALVSKFCKGI